MCVEFNNVLAAKHNIKSLPSAISDFSESQKIMASLNNKAAYICMLILGKDKVLNYENGDSRAFIQLLDYIRRLVYIYKYSNNSKRSNMYES